jgi:hypothetical protein
MRRRPARIPAAFLPENPVPDPLVCPDRGRPARSQGGATRARDAIPASLPLTLAVLAALILPACSGGRDASLSVRLVYGQEGASGQGGASPPVDAVAAGVAGTATPQATYPQDPENRILIRVLAPHIDPPMEAWFDRSTGKGTITGILPGDRIAVEVDEYDNTARTLMTNAPLLGRGWVHGLTLAPGEHKQVAITMHDKGTIVTVAGILGVPGDDNDEKIAIESHLNQPYDIEINDLDNIYVLDYSNRKIKKLDRYGYIGVFAGNGTSIEIDNVYARQSGLANPMAIAIDSDDNVYVACATSNKIRIVSRNIINVYAGNGFSASSEAGTYRLQASINAPSSICWKRNDGLFFVELPVGEIKLIDLNGVLQYRPDQSEYYGGNTGPITSVSRISSGSESFLFVSKKSLNLFSSYYGGLEHKFSQGSNFWPEGACVLSNSTDSKIFIADSGGYRVFMNPIDTTQYIEFIGPVDGLISPSDVAVDSRGNVYIADTGNHAIRMVVGGALP